VIAGAVLSGGASRRMGGRPKALLPWPPHAPQGTFLDVIALTLAEAGVARVCVVTGEHHAAIDAAVPSPPSFQLIHNQRHREGQLTSLWAALDWAAALDPLPEWLLVTLVDLPAVRPDTVRRLLAAASGDTEALAVRPAVGPRHGHPVLWRCDAWAHLRHADPHQGARPVIRALAAAGRVLDVAVDDEGVLHDIDTPEEWVRSRHTRGQV
jgi:molybdenum cofactor cytidylyltransferase